jgi:hypothetical protein
MMSSNKVPQKPQKVRDRDARFGEALGAAQSIQVPEEAIGPSVALGPLVRAASERLRSTGGRPTDPDWTVTRQVPFSEQSWGTLGRLAFEISSHGRRVAPAQLAAMLVEEGLERLGDTDQGASSSHSARLGSTAAELDEHLSEVAQE